jgi:glutamate carboxypeptidase
MDQITQKLIALANINTHWQNTDGIKDTFDLIFKEFKSFSDTIKQYKLPPIKQTNITGQSMTIPTWALVAKKRPDAPIKVLLSIHIDTVYPQTSPFQSCTEKGARLHGPGVCDAKGGLLILLHGLKAFEKKNHTKIGWTVIINAEEEIGSPSSSSLLIKHALQNHIGLIFEPTLPNGNWVSQRKGSSNITLISHGIASHAGRHFFKGMNAITQLTDLIQEWTTFFPNHPDRTINIGQFSGGTATNQTPDLAISKVNIRTTTKKMMDKVLQDLKTRIASHPHISMEVDSYRPPKPFNPPTQQLFNSLKTVDPTLKWSPSGGVCDGNILASVGLPTIDTFGPIGNHIHTHNEYVDLPSIKEKTKLLVKFLTLIEKNTL